MAYFPSTLSTEASDTLADYCESRIAERGWGLWALELRGDGAFMGFVGLEVPNYELPFSPCTEIGWRLARPFWGSGYATEAAAAVLPVGFGELGLEEIVSFTALGNLRSRAVMERLGMRNTQRNFLHPALAEDSPLREHCLYVLSRERWEAGLETDV